MNLDIEEIFNNWDANSDLKSFFWLFYVFRNINHSYNDML